MAEPGQADETASADEGETGTAGTEETGQTSLVAEEDQADKAAAAETPDESTGLIDKLKDNPGALAGVGAGVLLMSALAWLIFRRKEEEPVVIDEVGEELIDDAESLPEETIAADTLSEDELAQTAQISAEEVMIQPEAEEMPVVPEEEEEPGTLIGAADETSEFNEDEVLAEANVYLAYGLHDQAVDLLKPAVEAHPERNDYIAKLAEAYHAVGDKDAFIATAQKMQGPADGADKKLFQRVAVMGKDIAPDHEMFVNADTGDLTLTAITSRPDALTETGVESDMPETMTIDSDDIGLSPDDTQLPDLDELSKSLQMEETEALKELRESAMEELEDESLDVTNIQAAPDFADVKDEALDEVKEGLSDLTSAADESVAELDTRTLTLAMGNMEDDLSLDELEDDFNSLTTGADEISTKLDLAKAYIDMGDDEGAREALEEVIANGSEEQQGAARKLLEQLK
jgi:pilus assembly protein FimV